MPRVPDPNALRRDRKDDLAWTRLTPRDPAAAVPDFPLADPTPRDLHWWRDAWSHAQANEWEKNDEHAAVALYCRLMARAEELNAPVTLLRPLMQLRTELGLSPTGINRRRWLMPDAASPGRPAAVTPIRGRATGHPSARDRFPRDARYRFPRVTPTPDHDPAPI